MYCNLNYTQTLPTIEEQAKKNEKFLKEYNKLKKQEQNYPLYTWNANNTIESMTLKTCLANDPRGNRKTS